MAEPLLIDTPEGFTYELGLCSEHLEPAKRYSDDSWGCWWERVVETSEHNPGDIEKFVPIRMLTE